MNGSGARAESPAPPAETAMETLASPLTAAAEEPAGRDARRALPAWAGSAMVHGFWTLLALLFASQIYLGMLSHGHQWWRLFLWQAAVWNCWGALTLAVAWLARKVRLDVRGGPGWIPVVAHLALSVVAALVHLLPFTFFTLLLDPYQPVEASQGFVQTYAWLLPSWFPVEVVLYWAVLALVYGWDYYHRFRERELKATQLEALLARAELRTLELQLHPHFLFNSLNAVSGLVRRGDSAGAVKMLAGIGELLRRVLDNAGRQLVPLEEEIDFIRRYLDLQSLRFRDRLETSIEVEPAALTVPVPTLILQPLVENALEHGVGGRGHGRLRLAGRLDGDRLLLEVEDDGAGLEGDAAFGRGLGNTRARLAAQYGEAARLDLLPREAGATARIELPVAPEPAG